MSPLKAALAVSLLQGCDDSPLATADISQIGAGITLAEGPFAARAAAQAMR